MEVSSITDDQESMGTTGGYPEALMGVRRKVVAVPSPIGRRAVPKINQNVINGSRGDPDELALCGGTGLVVKTTEDMLGGAGVVVLNEIIMTDEIAEGGLVPGLKEEASGITEDLRLEEEGVVNFGGKFLHEWKRMKINDRIISR